MTEFDKEYLKLLKEILQRGEEVENRTGVNTIKIDKYTLFIHNCIVIYIS